MSSGQYGGSWKQFSLHQASCVESPSQAPVALQVVSGGREVVVVVLVDCSGVGSVVGWVRLG